MKAISQPFRFDGYGKVVMTTDPSKVWADRTKAAVTTPLGTRIMRPSYGSATPLQVFSNTEDAGITIDSDISEVFNKWLPELTFNGVVAEEDPENAELFLTVNYSTPLALESDQVTVVVEY